MIVALMHDNHNHYTHLFLLIEQCHTCMTKNAIDIIIQGWYHPTNVPRTAPTNAPNGPAMAPPTTAPPPANTLFLKELS